MTDPKITRQPKILNLAYLAIYPDHPLAAGGAVLELDRVSAVQKRNAPVRHEVRPLLGTRLRQTATLRHDQGTHVGVREQVHRRFINFQPSSIPPRPWLRESWPCNELFTIKILVSQWFFSGIGVDVGFATQSSRKFGSPKSIELIFFMSTYFFQMIS